jgi:hypothetical protein
VKGIISSLVVLSLVSGLAGHADAANPQQQKRVTAAQSGNSSPAKARGNRKPAASVNSSDYAEQIRDKAPFGSKRWWSVYERQHGTPY